MRNVHGGKFVKPHNQHKYWSCEAFTSFLLSKTGFYYEMKDFAILFSLFL